MGWQEWHRGNSSDDCWVYAVCVDEDHWIARNSTIISYFTGYGQGAVSCNGDIAIGAEAYCTDGDLDINCPEDDLSGWKEWHKGASSNDYRVYATYNVLRGIKS